MGAAPLVRMMFLHALSASESFMVAKASQTVPYSVSTKCYLETFVSAK